MAEVWMYTVAASRDPDNITCKVPWRLDENMVFFGPCKRRMRERIRKRFMRSGVNHATIAKDLYIIGIIGRNVIQPKKEIVRAGKLSEVMTFCEAWQHDLTSDPRQGRHDFVSRHVN